MTQPWHTRYTAFTVTVGLTLFNFAGYAEQAVAADDLSETGRVVWEKTVARLDDILETRDEYYQLPDTSWLGRDKSDADEELIELYGDVISAMQISGLRELSNDYQELNGKLESARQRLQEYREAQVSAPSEKNFLSLKTTKAEIGKRIDEERETLEEIKRRQDELLDRIVALFDENGMRVTRDQARLYLSLSAVGEQDDIITLYSIYFNVCELNRQVAAQIRAGEGEPDTIKRYYGMHVVLTRTMLIGYNRVLESITGDYLPRITALRSQAAEAMGVTQRLLSREGLSDSQRGILAGNYEAQQKFMEICDAAERYLKRMYERLEQQRDRVKTNYEIAENTYMTAWVGAGLLETVNQFNSDVQALQRMSFEPVIPLNDEAIMRQFNEFTERL
jgi:hypothetical protein